MEYLAWCSALVVCAAGAGNTGIFQFLHAVIPFDLIPASNSVRAASPRLIFSISESLSSLVLWFIVILNDKVSASRSFCMYVRVW